jgi:6-phosphogluconolactonase (cycloisomerase 2 family)
MIYWAFQITDQGIVEANPSSTHSGDGYGPRHLAVDHQRDMLYVIHELKPVIVSYKVNLENGGLEKLQDIDILEQSGIPESEHKWPFQYPGKLILNPKSFK